MSDWLIYLVIFMANFWALLALMMISKRHSKKFHITKPQLLSKLAYIMMVVSFGFVFITQQPAYFGMAWFLLLSFAAVLIYLGLVIYDHHHGAKIKP